jgi:diacylglycerol kinase (ATP)
MKQKHFGLLRIVKAASYSWEGLKYAFATAPAFRQGLLCCAVLAVVSLFLHVARAERAVMIGVLFLIPMAELINSALEATIDRISQELHPLSKCVKDMGSAAVLLAFFAVFAVWAIILF